MSELGELVTGTRNMFAVSNQALDPYLGKKHFFQDVLRLQILLWECCLFARGKFIDMSHMTLNIIAKQRIPIKVLMLAIMMRSHQSQRSLKKNLFGNFFPSLRIAQTLSFYGP